MLMPLCFSRAMKSLVAERALARALTSPASWMAPPYSSSFSVCSRQRSTADPHNYAHSTRRDVDPYGTDMQHAAAMPQCARRVELRQHVAASALPAVRRQAPSRLMTPMRSFLSCSTHYLRVSG
eukprot:GHRQ01019054.1.p1 GENE.GHRQ01019054.1~~GHRQ01019054.1.p1  ORF type:complete len:124 (+),score=10.59 GHRQ01019054.1:924-1295(+)